jgi:NO-binding membrane sensor protein with MHYT domain
MAEVDHFAYGLVTPVTAYVISVLGSLLGLNCTVRARNAPSARRRVWFLLLAAWAIGGTGIWTMHFIAMIGFGVSGTEIRYDVPLTTASALIAVVVVGVGLVVAGLGRPRAPKIILGGLFAGLGVAAMHYTGMAAMRFDGSVRYDDLLVAASVAIAIVAATAALWFTVTVRRPVAIFTSALVMGLAVCGMHYTGMYAMEVHVHDDGGQLSGSTAFALILPIILLVILVVIALIYAVLAVPTVEDLAGAAYVDARHAGRELAASGPPEPSPPAGSLVADRTGGHGNPSARRQSIPRATRRRRS